ncbi:Nn.00g017520.m01.CDS01 [Neocucurbitaria sp. VM-36]
MSALEDTILPDVDLLNLGLSHPTSDEHITIWTSTSALWADSLTLPLYIRESLFLATAPLARDGGLTTWILVDKRLPPDQREILSSCETFRKRSLTSDAEGNVSENIVHGIASVFCPPKYRGCGYAKRMMRELARKLFTWQADDETQCIGSILYSDIGKSYYAKLGWHPNKSNAHVEVQPLSHPRSALIEDVRATDLPALCKRDEALLRRRMAHPTTDARTRMTIIPDLEHMGWQLAKEDFACNHLFSTIPHAKGAIAGGAPGSQVWAIWTRRYYSRHDVKAPNNVLYILRLVMEEDETATRLPSDAGKMLQGEKYAQQMCYLKAILQAAQAEAHAWKLDVVKLWDPSPLVRGMLKRMDMGHVEVEREEESIASGLWYGGRGEARDSAPLWVNNEHYAWL